MGAENRLTAVREEEVVGCWVRKVKGLRKKQPSKRHSDDQR